MTDDEIKIRLIRQEVAAIIDYYDEAIGTQDEILETIVDRVIDLEAFISNDTPLPVMEVEEIETMICSYCAGSGEGMHSDTKCSYCNGWGEVPAEEGDDREDYGDWLYDQMKDEKLGGY